MHAWISILCRCLHLLAQLVSEEVLVDISGGALVLLAPFLLVLPVEHIIFEEFRYVENRHRFSKSTKRQHCCSY